MWFIGVEVEQETSAPPSKKNPGSFPGVCVFCLYIRVLVLDRIFPSHGSKNRHPKELATH